MVAADQPCLGPRHRRRRCAAGSVSPEQGLGMPRRATRSVMHHRRRYRHKPETSGQRNQAQRASVGHGGQRSTRRRERRTRRQAAGPGDAWLAWTAGCSRCGPPFASRQNDQGASVLQARWRRMRRPAISLHPGERHDGDETRQQSLAGPHGYVQRRGADHAGKANVRQPPLPVVFTALLALWRDAPAAANKDGHTWTCNGKVAGAPVPTLATCLI